MTEAVTARMNPITLAERIETIDIVRGLALFGILASNMRAFNSPLATYMDHSLMWLGSWDRIAQGFVDLVISGKFITIFSFLFGLGFAVMMERAEARGVVGRGFYFRRVGLLFAMGVIHAIFIWYGDILSAYGFMGFFLYLFRRRSPVTVLRWALLLYCWPIVVSVMMTTLVAAGVPIPPPTSPTPEQFQATIQAYSSGTYMDIFRERMKENAFMAFAFAFYYPRLLGLFLAGLWVWRKGVVKELGAHRELLVKLRNWGLTVGLVLSGVTVALNEIYHPNPMGFEPLTLAINVIGSIGVPALSLGYMTAVALLFQKEEWKPRLRPFGAVGRTALTNYLSQTALCTTLYYSWGFGLYGRVGPLLGLVSTFVFYALLVVLSNWWVKRFAFGPLEWGWRTLTYGQAPAIHRAPAGR